MHVAQSLPALAEENVLMMIDQNIITQQSARPVLGFVQDCLSSMYLLCQPDVTFRLDQAMTLYMRLHYPRQPFVRRKVTTGYEIFSYLLPKSLQYACHGVEIVDGMLVACANGMTSKVLGTNNGGLIHALARYPVDENAYVTESLRATQAFISDGQRLGLAFLEVRGFSVGVGDMLTTPAQQAQFAAFLQDGCEKAQVEARVVTKYDRQASQKELNILARLDKATSDAAALAQDALSKDNNVSVMLKSGSKGKPSNVMQMSACVGQQIISGFRPQIGFQLSGRTLPHYTAEESLHVPEARGFIKSSFVQGLNAQEYFAAAQGGREGMTDTSIKSVTGDTLVLIEEVGDTKVVRIGEWIDHLLKRADRKDVAVYPEELNTEILTLPHDYVVRIPTVDERGHFFWSALTAVTRHDTDGVLFRIHVASFDGKIITVTVPGSKSLLIWRETAAGGAFVPTKTTDAKVYDRVPVAHDRTLYFGEKGVDLVKKSYMSENSRRGDVSLKQIVFIERIVLKESRRARVKLYDVTVPATYNFVLANGLGVRDTRDSGYFTRKLVKFFENATVAYDGTVRIQGPNTKQPVVQFAYGDDGVDPLFLELQQVVLYKASDNQMFLLAADSPLWHEALTMLASTLRDNFPNHPVDKFYVPVNVKQLIAFAACAISPHGEKVSDWCAWYAQVNDTMAALNVNILIRAHLFGSLAPQCVRHLAGNQRDWLLEKVTQRFETSRVMPGEKVGIIAAQSFGQLAVQVSIWFSRHSIRNQSA